MGGDPFMKMVNSCCTHAELLSRVRLQSFGWQPARFLWPWYFPGNDTGMGCHFPRNYGCLKLPQTLGLLSDPLWELLMRNANLFLFHFPNTWLKPAWGAGLVVWGLPLHVENEGFAQALLIESHLPSTSPPEMPLSLFPRSFRTVTWIFLLWYQYTTLK